MGKEVSIWILIHEVKSNKHSEQMKKEELKQAVIVDYKAIGCKCPGGGDNTKPFIQYTLEWLLIEKFDQLFVCCLPDNVVQMRAFVKRFLETENVPSSMRIEVHSCEKNRSTGDCLRDLDRKALLKTDFVIMDVGCCGNLPLAELLEAHRRLKKTDKNAILTSIVRNLYTKNPGEIGEFPIYVTDPKTGQILHYVAGRLPENTVSSSDVLSKGHINIPSEIFLDREAVKIHTNLCSTNLSIYSADVPARFSDFFDLHSEAEFIRAAFDDQEVSWGSVYIHIVDDLFSQRMADFGFVINQKWDKFDTNLIYKRNERSQVLRQLVNDSLIDCTRIDSDDYVSNLSDHDDDDSDSESELEPMPMDDEDIYLCEVLESLVRGYEENIKNENLVLEVNSSKHAYNISIDDVYSTIARAPLLLPEKLNRDKPNTIAEYSRIVESIIIKFKQFLLNYIKSEESRKAMIEAMEELLLSDQVEFLTDVTLAKILYKLYEIDALDEDSIISWFRHYDGHDQERKELREKQALRQLVQALEADSDEED